MTGVFVYTPVIGDRKIYAITDEQETSKFKNKCSFVECRSALAENASVQRVIEVTIT